MNTTCPEKFTKRKVLRRSRYGCRNCKLRKVKCDESKPQCNRCSSFGILCNFKSNVPDLQPLANDSVNPLVVRDRVKIQPPLTNAVWASDGSTFYQLSTRCQDLITRYLGRSLITPDDLAMKELNSKLFPLTFTHPFLMHASLAIALAYDRYLNNPQSCGLTHEECYHWFQSTSLFNKRLKEPIDTKDKDPIWGTAAAYVVLTFSNPETHKPDEMWPLKQSASSDFEWSRMSKGKMSLWHIVNPLRPDSIYCIMASTFAQMHTPLPEKGIEGMEKNIAALCKLTDSSTQESNPYFGAAYGLSRISNLEDCEITIGKVELFTRSMHGPFKSLLLEKDPVALLLLYLWYCRAGRGVWWVQARARFECPSICSYLRLYHKDYSDIHAFLPGGHLAGG